MTRARREDVVRTLWDAAWNHGDMSALDVALAPGFVRHASHGQRRSAQREPQDLEGFKADIAAVRAGFPDLHTTIDDLLVDGDKVAVRWSSEGTHAAAFMDTPPTGRRVRAAGVTISRFDGDRIREDWVTWDRGQSLLGLGIVPIGLEP